MIPARFQRLRILLMCLLMAGLALLLDRASPLIEHLELMTLNWRFVRRGPVRPGPDVVLVTIDEKSLIERGQWPWPLSYHADLVEILRERGAAVVAFDVVFAERPKDREEGALFARREARFEQALRRAGNVLLAGQLPERGTMSHGAKQSAAAVEVSLDRILSSRVMAGNSPPAPTVPPPWMEAPTKAQLWTLPLPGLLRAARGVGHVDLPADPDATYRRVVLLRPVDNGRLYPQLALLAAACKLAVSPGEIGAGSDGKVHLGDRRAIPVGADGTFLIDFAGPPASAGSPSMYPSYSYTDVLKPGPRSGGAEAETLGAEIPADAFRGKIVFVGATALYDLRPSPYSAINTGVETNANLANAILQQRFFTLPGTWSVVLLVMGVGLVFGPLLAALAMPRATLATLFAAIAYTLVAHWQFTESRVILPMVTPLVALGLCYTSVMAYRFQTEFRERQRNRAYLDLYVTRQVAERIINDPAAATLGVQRAQVSVLFADIRDFTAMSEAMSPESVAAILNEYFERMVAIIMDQDGTLMQYVGDEIMGVWGAPVEQPDHAHRAVRAGLAMLAALRELHAEWRGRGLPVFEIGVGIHSGTVVAGNIGARKRVQYSVVGDTVNTAARTEQLNKELGTHMIITRSTYDLLDGLAEVRPLPPVMVKGKVAPLTVYEVLGPRREQVG